MIRRLTAALSVILAASGTAGCGSESESTSTPADGGTSITPRTPRLFYLDIIGRVLRAEPDGSGATVLVEGLAKAPDGIAVDEDRGHLYWTNMGLGAVDDGSIERADLNGGSRTSVVETGGAFTPKQLELDAAHAKLYWSDREGMSVMRSNLDGSEIETLVTIADGDAARADAANWAVGMAIDLEHGHVYWTQKGPDDGGVGTIKRAGLELPPGETPASRSDVELLFSSLPEPIDLELDLTNREIYWTDRGDNTVNRAAMDPPPGADPAGRADREILVTGLAEAIGIALDVDGGEMYFTDLGGTVGKAALDGSGKSNLLTAQGALTGIAFVKVPE